MTNYVTNKNIINKHNSLSNGKNSKKRFDASKTQDFRRKLLNIQSKIRRKEQLTSDEQKFVMKFGYLPIIA